MDEPTESSPPLEYEVEGNPSPVRKPNDLSVILHRFERDFEEARDQYVTALVRLWNSMSSDEWRASLFVPWTTTPITAKMRASKIAKNQLASLGELAKQHPEFAMSSIWKSRDMIPARWKTYVQLACYSWAANIQAENAAHGSSNTLVPKYTVFYAQMEKSIVKLRQSADKLLDLQYSRKNMVRMQGSLKSTLTNYADEVWAESVMEELRQGKTLYELQDSFKEYNEKLQQLEKLSRMNPEARKMAQSSGVEGLIPVDLERLKRDGWLSESLSGGEY
jgi:hypothetical protein